MLKYTEIKATTLSMVDEHMAKGLDKETAERRVLKAGINMFESKKIGVIELKLMFQILGYEFSGELKESMNAIKAAMRAKFHLDEIVQDMLSKGYTKEQANEVAAKVCYEVFLSQKGENDPEMLDAMLWALGYRLKEEFYLDYYDGKNPEFAYEIDD